MLQSQYYQNKRPMQTHTKQIVHIYANFNVYSYVCMHLQIQMSLKHITYLLLRSLPLLGLRGIAKLAVKTLEHNLILLEHLPGLLTIQLARTVRAATVFCPLYRPLRPPTLRPGVSSAGYCMTKLPQASRAWHSSAQAWAVLLAKLTRLDMP